ncbi:MAG: 6-phosphogluconolactonase [Candidatus Limnocylindrales bacterium]
MSIVASGEPEIIVVPDPDAGAVLAAERIAAALTRAASARGRADWVTTGGSTPIGIYRQLSEPPLRERVPWSDVQVWWGDDRFVPRDHPLSNVKPLDDILLDTAGARAGTASSARGGVPLPVANLHPIPTGSSIAAGLDIQACAAAAAAELEAADLALLDGWPVFDLILLGIGGDGHLLSVFPNSPTFDDPAWVLGVAAPDHIEPHVPRVTMNSAVLAVARQILVVSNGSSKADIVGTIFGSVRDERRWPAQLARRPNATWILDAAAAARLSR